MFAKLVALAFLISASAALLSEAPQTRTPGNVYMCTEENWQGTCEVITFTPGNCVVAKSILPGENIGSIGPNEGTTCYGYE
ncbi:hypothetical protein BDN72DRAFT_903747 [Pluteus cervinus]|uniref:Uncharacterized protein n=1 Tax=Pluteus cervinus TaxID=181527 RepID=A0ACD3A804_9AGAR|nr:hypothetical protein BDN72DRAFT_903747 [Pluteus cervinus]